MDKGIIIKDDMLKMALNEIIFDIKAIKGIKIIMLVFCILIFPMDLYMNGENYNLRTFSFALPFSIGYCFTIKLNKAMYMIPIDNKSFLRYIRYKFCVMVVISSLAYLIASIVSFLFFKKDVSIIITDFIMRYIPVIIMLNVIVWKLDWDVKHFKSYNLKKSKRIWYVLDIYILNYACLELFDGIVKYVVIISAYICAILLFKTFLVTFKKNGLIEDFKKK